MNNIKSKILNILEEQKLPNNESLVDEIIDEVNIEFKKKNYITKDTLGFKKGNRVKIKIRIAINLLYSSFECLEGTKKYNKTYFNNICNTLRESELILKKNCDKVFSAAESIYKTCIKNNTQLFFKQSYHCETLKEYYLNVIDNLKAWVDNNDDLMVEYPLLYLLDKNNLKKLITYDIEFLKLDQELSKVGNKKHNTNMTNIDIYPYEVYFEIPVDPSSRKKMTRVGDLYKYEHKVNEDVTITTTVSIPNSEDGTIIEPKILNQFDINVICSLIRFSTDDFLITKSVLCDLKKIVSDVCGAEVPGTKMYQSVVDSIRKVNTLTKEIYDSSSSDVKEFHIYKADVVTPQENQDNINGLTSKYKFKDKKVKASFSEKFINYLLNGVVITERGINPKSKLLSSIVGPLQGKRYEACKQGIYKMQLDYEFFNAAIVLGYRYKSRNIKNIALALDELVKMKSIILGYRVIGDVFEIEFLPIEKDEKASLLSILNKWNTPNGQGGLKLYGEF